MNKKGFTLIEIIGAIVILGIIAIIAFATYTNSLKGFREDYYKDTIRTIEKAAKEFFTDNRNYRPSKILNAQEVNVSTLQVKNYINNVVDYNGGACDTRSYVLVVKEGKDKFSYHGCLICDEDGYSNTKDNIYCDRTWLDPTKVEYGLGEMNDKYIYKGTTRDELKEELELPVSYVRKDSNGNIIATRVGTKEGDPTLLPLNIDVVNTNVIGNYKVTYEYGVERGDRNVIVYENVSPTIEYRKQNTRLKELDGTTETDSFDDENNDYVSGTWVQAIRVRINPIDIVEDGVTVSKYQWNKDGKWQDFDCTGNPCTKKITDEMNQTVQFRVVDSKGHISKTTIPITFRIDNTKPVCELEIPTSKGENNWYNTNVTIRFKTKYDNKRTEDTSLISGYDDEHLKYNIQKTTNNVLDKTVRVASVTHTEDTASVQYRGYIVDQAENFNTCDTTTFKKDSIAPNCSISGHATITCTDSLSQVNRWRYSTTNDPNGTYTSITKTSSFTHDASSLVTAAGTYYLYGKDEAGNVSAARSYTYYTVTYDLHGGAVSPNKTSYIVRSGNNADLTPVASKDGYIFIGWNTNASATTKLTSYSVTGNVTLHAIYEVCGNGYYCKNNVKTGCPGGYYGNGTTTGSTQAASCTLCETGHYCGGITDRHACGAGTYNPNTGQSSSAACKGCGCGKYSSAGAASCSNISAGCYGTSASGSCPNTCSNGSISSAGSCSCSTCPSGTTSNSNHTQCIAVNPTVTLWKYETGVSGSRCGIGGATQVSSIAYTCNGTWCNSINAANCRLYAFWIQPPTGQSFSSITITFSGTRPNDWVAATNSYDGAPSGLPAFQGKTYLVAPGDCNVAECEEGGGTNKNFFNYKGNTYMFRFRPSEGEFKNNGGTISGTITVGYSGGGTGSVNFSYSVSKL